jgi:hypothetical protein
MKPIIVALLLLASFDDRTRDDWLRLAIEMEQSHKLDQADRRYLRLMIQLMDMNRDVKPTLGQQKEIIEIKRKLDDLD